MTRRLVSYLRVAYRPAFYVPFMLLWAIGLTALFTIVTGAVHQWRPDRGVVITALTLVLDMLLLRALDDLGDHGYDRVHNPGRPLPSGLVRERDLQWLVAVLAATVLVLNAGRGAALVMLAVQLGYTAVVTAVDRLWGFPPHDRLLLHMAVNMPIQPLLSLYVYAGFLQNTHQHVSVQGLSAVLAVTLGAMCLEFGRKVTRQPRPGERTYVTQLGTAGTSGVALTCAVVGVSAVLAVLRPWHPAADAYGWGWLAVLPLALPSVAFARFAAGARRWPVAPTLGYVPAMYLSFIAISWLTVQAPV
ncbi:hypothetical protein [Dactylosporangium sp. NPDC005555]|uniref:hypothetical protein n=1 Tax=Dactylosporangium sp. NPDC005555 TaxID=3154889 RepID=UPI0033BDB272